MPSQAEKGSVLPHALSSVMAKQVGESTWAWPLSPAAALKFSSFPAYSTSHLFMILPNPFLGLLVLPAPTTASAQRGVGLTSQCLYWVSSPAVAGLDKQQLCLPLPHCCPTAAPPAQTQEPIPKTSIFSSPGPCPELHQHQVLFCSCLNGSWEHSLWEISPRTSEVCPIFRWWCDKFL